MKNANSLTRRVQAMFVTFEKGWDSIRVRRGDVAFTVCNTGDVSA